MSDQLLPDERPIQKNMHPLQNQYPFLSLNFFHLRYI
jgi:hypothetical protein